MRRRAFLAVAAAGGVLAYGRAGKPGTHPAARPASHPHPAVPPSTPPSLPPAVVATVIAYARAQSGKPYLWGGTGPDSFDCSGLVMQAYAAAKITIPRTSQDQWKHLPHVSSPQPGDLVFFPGSDGTWTAPGHVGLVTGQHLMIQAYAPGTPIGTYTFGVDNRGADIGPQYVAGYARPRA